MAGRRMRRLTGAAILLGLLLPAGLAAQNLAVQNADRRGTGEAGGLRLTFGTALRLETAGNPDLSVAGSPRRTTAAAQLSFGLSDATRATAVDLAASGTLQAGRGAEKGLANPALRLGLRRSTADQSLGLSATLSQTDLAVLRALVLDPETGDVLGETAGSGTRQRSGADLVWNFGEGGPWGGMLSAGVTETTYRGLTTEPDSRRLRAGASLRHALDPATEASAGLRWSRFDAAGAAARDTLRADLGLRRALPAGAISAAVFAEDTPDGTRGGLTFGRSWDLPDGGLALSLGATRGVAGGIGLSAALDWSRELSDGRISASLRRNVSSGEDDRETRQTVLDLGLSQALGPSGRLSLGLTASESVATATGVATRNALVSAGYGLALPQDWSLAAGWRHRLRDRDGEGRAKSDTLFLELRRDTEWRR